MGELVKIFIVLLILGFPDLCKRINDCDTLFQPWIASTHNVILLSVFVLLVHISTCGLLKSVGFAECLFQCSQPPKKQIERSLVALPRLCAMLLVKRKNHFWVIYGMVSSMITFEGDKNPDFLSLVQFCFLLPNYVRIFVCSIRTTGGLQSDEIPIYLHVLRVNKAPEEMNSRKIVVSSLFGYITISNSRESVVIQWSKSPK